MLALRFPGAACTATGIDVESSIATKVQSPQCGRQRTPQGIQSVRQDSRMGISLEPVHRHPGAQGKRNLRDEALPLTLQTTDTTIAPRTGRQTEPGLTIAAPAADSLQNKRPWAYPCQSGKSVVSQLSSPASPDNRLNPTSGEPRGV